MTIHVDSWKLMRNGDIPWQFMTIHKSLWLWNNPLWFMSILEYSWLFMMVHDHSCQSMTIHDKAWQFMIIYDDSWQFMTIHGNSYQFMTNNYDSWGFMRIHDSVTTVNYSTNVKYVTSVINAVVQNKFWIFQNCWLTECLRIYSNQGWDIPE